MDSDKWALKKDYIFTPQDYAARTKAFLCCKENSADIIQVDFWDGFFWGVQWMHKVMGEKLLGAFEDSTDISNKQSKLYAGKTKLLKEISILLEDSTLIPSKDVDSGWTRFRILHQIELSEKRDIEFTNYVQQRLKELF